MPIYFGGKKTIKNAIHLPKYDRNNQNLNNACRKKIVMDIFTKINCFMPIVCGILQFFPKQSLILPSLKNHRLKIFQLIQIKSVHRLC